MFHLSMIMKHCAKCCLNKAISEFSACSKHGTQRYCKTCRSLYAKENRDRKNSTEKAWRVANLTDNTEQIKRILFRRTTFYRNIIAQGMCAVCKKIKGLCIHHIDENIENNTPDNLLVICRACHSKHHKGMKILPL